MTNPKNVLTVELAAATLALVLPFLAGWSYCVGNYSYHNRHRSNCSAGVPIQQVQAEELGKMQQDQNCG
ncbi:MAG: hypothetical protein ACRD5H_11685 [Nitrososphaerales archaeon]